MLVSVSALDCQADLPDDIYDDVYYLGYDTGYGWGYYLILEDEDRTDIFWTRPHAVEAAQEYNPELVIRDYSIPKGYWTTADLKEAHLPDGTPFNKKQKEQVMEAYNWGFYLGFMDGGNDCLAGEPDRRHLGIP